MAKFGFKKDVRLRLEIEADTLEEAYNIVEQTLNKAKNVRIDDLEDWSLVFEQLEIERV